MIELSKWQLYVFLIVLTTVTQLVCLKKGKTHNNYLYTKSNYFLFFFPYIFKLLLLKYICAHISLPKQIIVKCSIRAIHEIYGTLRYQINL